MYMCTIYHIYYHYIYTICTIYIYPGPSHGPSGSSVPHAPRAARWSAAPQSPQPSWGAGFATPNCGFYGDLTAQKNDETWNFYVQVWHDEEMTDQTMFFGGFTKNSAVQNPSNEEKTKTYQNPLAYSGTWFSQWNCRKLKSTGFVYVHACTHLTGEPYLR